MRIQDYARFTGISIIQPQRTKITIPAFTLPASTWAGASVLLSQYPFGNDNWFSLKLPVKKFGRYFIAAVRYYDEDNDVIIRYKLWDDVLGLLYYPIYAGEVLGPNAVIEIWSINSASDPVLASDKILYSSVLNFPPQMTCNSCCIQPDGSLLLGATPPSVLPPYAYCNPFCDGLCIP